MSDDAIDEKETKDLRERMPFAVEMGLEVLEVSKERVRVRASWKPEFCTSSGVAHGGFLMAIADTAGALLAVQHLPPGAGTTTLESKTNFLRALREGTVIASAEPVHAGRTSIVVMTDLRDDAGKLLTRTTQTQMVLAEQ
jgi:1,4-dihydroxy-2-naphthoyl-CoA hydrolase